jgi:hypothetical protein
MSLRAGLCFGGAFALAGASCSLFALSYEEATKGLHGRGTDGDPNDATPDGTFATDGDSTRDGNSAPDAGGSDVADDQGQPKPCGSACVSCNGGHCASCGFSGSSCKEDGDCCGDNCDPATNACVSPSSSCLPGGQSCVEPAQCCAGLTCSPSNSTECHACLPNLAPCLTDYECCTLHCGSGQCLDCLDVGSVCDPGAGQQCCSGKCHAQDAGSPQCVP